MGFCFFTENTTLNIHSLGLNVGQLVHCICVGGGGGGGGGAGGVNALYVTTNNIYTWPYTSFNGQDGGTGGITSFGNYISARGGGGGKGGVAYARINTTNNMITSISGTNSAAGGMSYLPNSAGGSGCGAFNSYNGTGNSYYPGRNVSATCGGGGGGAGEYVYKSFVLNEELIPITIGNRGKGGAGGNGVYYNFANNMQYLGNYRGGNGGDGGNAGQAHASSASIYGGGGGSGFGAGGGGGAGREGYFSNTASSWYGGGAGGGAGGYFIGEQRIYDKAGASASTSSSNSASSGYSLDYATMYPRNPVGQSGRTYPVLNKQGCGVCILMW